MNETEERDAGLDEGFGSCLDCSRPFQVGTTGEDRRVSYCPYCGGARLEGMTQHEAIDHIRTMAGAPEMVQAMVSGPIAGEVSRFVGAGLDVLNAAEQANRT